MPGIATRGDVLSNEMLESVREKIVWVVEETLRLRPMPSGHVTERELQDRLDVTVEIWNHLYGRCGWSAERAMDALLSLLIKCVDGARLHDVAPSSHAGNDGATMWAPEQLEKIEPERRLSALAVGHDTVTEDGPTIIVSKDD